MGSLLYGDRVRILEGTKFKPGLIATVIAASDRSTHADIVLEDGVPNQICKIDSKYLEYVPRSEVVPFVKRNEKKFGGNQRGNWKTGGKHWKAFN